MEEITSIELFKNPLDLKQQTSVINAAIISIAEGEVNPIAVEITLKAWENVIKAIRETQVVKDVVRKETSKYGKVFSFMGAEITNATRNVYDYSVCRDEIYNSLIKEMEKLKEQIKIREKVLQSGVDISSGEVFQKPISKTSEFLKIVFKKD